jgi:hypothetical protein
MKRIILTWLVLCAALFGAWQLSAIDIPHFKIEQLLVKPAHAQIIGSGIWGDVRPLSGATYTQESALSGNNASGSSTYSTTLTFNTGSADVPVVFGGTDLSGSLGLSSLTIGGTSATIVQSGRGAFIAYIAPAALTTATVVATFTGTPTAGGIAIGSGKVTTTTPTPYASNQTSGQSFTGGGTPTTLTANIAANGVGVALFGGFGTSCANAATWTGTTSSSGDSSVCYTNPAATDSVSVSHSTTQGSPATVGVTFAGNSFVGAAIVTWQP